jgi:hypothetical protein
MTRQAARPPNRESLAACKVSLPRKRTDPDGQDDEAGQSSVSRRERFTRLSLPELGEVWYVPLYLSAGASSWMAGHLSE